MWSKIVLRQVIYVKAETGFTNQSCCKLIVRTRISYDIVIYRLCYAILQIWYWISSNIAHGEVGILIGVGIVIWTIGLVDGNNRWHEQSVCQGVSNTTLVWRRIERYASGCCQSVLLVATYIQGRLYRKPVCQLTISIQSERRTIETGVKHDTILINKVTAKQESGFFISTADC